MGQRCFGSLLATKGRLVAPARADSNGETGYQHRRFRYNDLLVLTVERTQLKKLPLVRFTHEEAVTKIM